MGIGTAGNSPLKEPYLGLSERVEGSLTRNSSARPEYLDIHIIRTVLLAVVTSSSMVAYKNLVAHGAIQGQDHQSAAASRQCLKELSSQRNVQHEHIHCNQVDRPLPESADCSSSLHWKELTCRYREHIQEHDCNQCLLHHKTTRATQTS
jgi:hypothetical protein